MEDTCTKMGLIMKDNGKMISAMELAHIHGLMVDNIQESGKITEKMVEEYIFGQMDHVILVNGKMDQEMVMVLFVGLMEENIKVNGVQEKMKGIGTYYWADGDKYIGEWLDGIRWGKGKFICLDGTIFEQDWNEQQKFDRNNKGTLTKDKKRMIEGEEEEDILMVKTKRPKFG